MSIVGKVAQLAIVAGIAPLMYGGVGANDVVATPADTKAVNQGDSIYSLGAKCTIGYVDKETNSFQTAAHCVGEVGEEVYNDEGEAIGTVIIRGDIEGVNKHRQDAAYVAISPGHTAGDNIYSGDKIVSLSDIDSGDKLYAYGASTGEVYHGKVDRVYSSMVASQPGMMPIPGDSGGPAWIKGKGYVGVTTGYYVQNETGYWTQPAPIDLQE